MIAAFHVRRKLELKLPSNSGLVLSRDRVIKKDFLSGEEFK